MHHPATRQKLFQAIAALPDDWLDEALQLIDSLRIRHTQTTHSPIANTPNTPTVLERMGGMPQCLIHNGQLSDRDRRRALIRDRIGQRHRRTP